MRIKNWAALPLIVGSIALTAPLAAQDAASLFKGKQVRLTVGFTPGGGYDAYTRLLSRHYGRFVPGNPDMIVVNMPGASSFKSVQYLNSGAPTDGTAITAFNPGLITQSMTIPDKVNVKFTDFAWIGSISEDLRVCYMWHETGVKTWDQMLARNPVIMGDTGAGSSSYVNQKMLQEVFDVKLKQILGYPGSAEKRIAIERGELEGDCGSWTSIAEDWIRDKKVNLVVRFSHNVALGLPESVPYAGDLLKDPKKKQVFQLLTSSAEIGRPFIAPKALSAERLKVLRVAFNETMKDPQFLADADKLKLLVTPMTGEAVEKELLEIYKAPPDVVAMAKEISGDN
jgi:tripartite-type tricarboxylate transporter receptor subunit TctC